jgi:hypothetical protein
MAEIELSVLSRPCLDRRIPDEATLRQDIEAFVATRNQAGARIEWRLTSQDARVKLHRLYPSVSG